MPTADTIESLAEALWEHLLATTPYLQLRAGQPIEALPAGSEDEAARDAAFGRDLAARAAAIDPAPLSATGRVTRDLLLDQARSLGERVELWWADFPQTPYSQFFTSMTVQQILPGIPLDTDGERFLSVTRSFATQIETVRTKTLAMAERGWVLPAPAFEGAMATFAGLRQAADAVLSTAAEDAPGDLADRIDKIRRDEVLPAFDGVLDLLQDGDHRDRAPQAVGLSQYPGGEEAYRRLVREHVTFDIEPDEVQRRGLAQMAELTAAKAELLSQMGFADEAALVAHLDGQGRLFAATPEDVEATYRRHIARIEPRLGSYFATLPAAEYDVQRLDESLEAGMSYGYYEPPTSANPIGRYRYNGSGLDTRSQLNAAALIYHELVPGHHFHIARQAEDERLPRFRAEGIGYAAFTEGWAEYAAALAGEMGMYADPVDAYGHLVHQSFLTCRLVVDPGMNALGMDVEEARAYMRANCRESETQVRTETIRYSTDIPAQALGYRLGHKAFEGLREQARAALGDRFDIAAFHEVTLGQGSRPMTVVADDVRRWIDEVA